MIDRNRIPAFLFCASTLLAPLSAGAAPSFNLTWSDTTGDGTTGRNTIEAAVGDTLTLDVNLTIDAEGFTSAFWDLVGSAGLLADTNSLTVGGGSPECPRPPNVVAGTCLGPTFRAFSPLRFGVEDVGSSTTGYDVRGDRPEFSPDALTVGRGVFHVTGSGMQVVSTAYGPGQGVGDGFFEMSIPAVASAFVMVPEPGSAALVGLGVLALALLRGRLR